MSTTPIERYYVRAHESGWIVPIDPRTGKHYLLLSRHDLVVQLWAHSDKSQTLAEIAQIHG